MPNGVGGAALQTLPDQQCLRAFPRVGIAGAEHCDYAGQLTEVDRTAERLHLPFPLLSDEKLAMTKALRLPTMQVAGMTLIKRMALVIDDGTISKVFYPLFPPDRNAGDVLAWLEQNGRT